MKYTIQIILFFMSLLINSVPVTANQFADDNTGKDDTQTYRIAKEVSLISKQKVFMEKNPKFSVKITYPFLRSPEKLTTVQDFNKQIAEFLSQEIVKFKTELAQYQNVQLILPPAKIKNALDIDFNAATIASGDLHIISIRFSIRYLLSILPQATHFHKSINYVLETGENIELSDLFQTNSPYLSLLSTYISTQLQKRDPQYAPFILQGTAPILERFKIWNISSHGLLITLEAAQAAPEIRGSQMILVPYNVLKETLSADSPLEECINKPNKCSTHPLNLLTGGFIDEVNARSISQFPAFSLLSTF